MKLYIFIGVVAAFGCGAAYIAGMRVGGLQCERDNAQNVHVAQTEIVKQRNEINAKVYHTGVRDIRRILREKYTIAE